MSDNEVQQHSTFHAYCKSG